MISSVPDSAVSVEPGFTFGDFHLEPDGTLWHEQTQIHLPPKELAALRLLLRQAGHVVTVRQLRDALWGEVHVSDDSVPRCISSLRARLDSETCIQTVYKQGYRMTWRVQRNYPPREPMLPRLAIVPFACGADVAEYLGPAVAEEATARLTSMHPPLFSMMARDSVFTLSRRGMSGQQVGETLKADLVLTGKLQAMASHFRLRMEMVRVADGTQIWVEDVLVPQERPAGLQAELVERLTFRATGRLSPEVSAAEESPIDAAAYDLYLCGRFEWQSLDRQRMQDGMRRLRKALQIDPKLTQARMELVRGLVAQELFGYLSPQQAAQQVRAIAGELAQDSSERIALAPALGWIAFHVDRDLQTALREFSSCCGMPPNSWHSRMRAMFAADRLRLGEAGELLLEALELDPYSAWVNAALAWVYHLDGRAEQSLRQIERCLELFPEHTATRLYAGMILPFQGEAARAVKLSTELTRHAPHLDMAMAVHAYALACSGEREKAEEWLERLQWLSRDRYVIRSFAAAAYVALGDLDSALGALRAAEQDRCPWFAQLLADPRLAALHDHPEFREMQQRLDAIRGAEEAEEREAECSAIEK